MHDSILQLCKGGQASLLLGFMYTRITIYVPPPFPDALPRLDDDDDITSIQPQLSIDAIATRRCC